MAWLRRTPVMVTITTDDKRDIIARSDCKEPISFGWPDIDEIQTYKVDLFAFDDICLAFYAFGMWYELSEKDAGFTVLAKVMRAKFPSIAEDWYTEVMHPAFARNQRTLWKRG